MKGNQRMATPDECAGEFAIGGAAPVPVQMNDGIEADNAVQGLRRQWECDHVGRTEWSCCGASGNSAHGC